MLARHILPAALLTLTCATCIRVGASTGPSERAEYKLVTAPPFSNLDSKNLNLLTLGHRGLYDDFAMVWAIQFLGDTEVKQKATADELNAAITTIVKHKPKIEALYLISCYVLALEYNRPEFCEYISVEGLKAFPDSWRIPMTQGFVASFQEKDDMKAAAFYQLAASRPTSPPYVARVAARMQNRGYANGQDLNETIELLKEVPGGTRIIEVLRERLQNREPPPRTGGQP